MSGRNFEVDKAEAKLMGVCAGLAKMTGLDATIIRIGFVVATLIGGWPWTLVAYFVLGLVGQKRRAQVRRSARGAIGDGGYRSSDLDRRMVEIETYVSSSNGRLAREIEELR